MSRPGNAEELTEGATLGVSAAVPNTFLAQPHAAAEVASQHLLPCSQLTPSVVRAQKNPRSWPDESLTARRYAASGALSSS